MNQLFKWCEQIKITEGYLRSCIYDLNRSEYELVLKKCQYLVDQIERKNTKLIDSFFSKSDMEWVNFFLEKEYILSIPENLFDNFTCLGLDFEQPNYINNSVVYSTNNLDVIIPYIDQLGCKHLHIVCETESELIIMMRRYFITTNFHSLEVSLLLFENNNEELLKICHEFPIISKIFVANENVKTRNTGGYFGNILRFKNKTDFTPTFVPRIETYLESQKHNLYFNKKLFIDKNGDIKNAKEVKSKSGNIKAVNLFDKLLSLVESKRFQKYWFSHKGITDVCKDCEFRHMCVDNRLPIERSENDWFHKTECNYNPYIAKWEGEEGYQTLEECGVISNENGFSIDHEKISKINAVLWGED
jgi:SPASM domain peptide maturase of grasp-with-spasm system